MGNVLASLCHLQSVLPEAVLVGGDGGGALREAPAFV